MKTKRGRQRKRRPEKDQTEGWLRIHGRAPQKLRERCRLCRDRARDMQRHDHKPEREAQHQSCPDLGGAQAREDFWEKDEHGNLAENGIRDDENWLKHTLCWADEAGNTRIDYRPVHLYTLSNDVEAVPPKKRTY